MTLSLLVAYALWFVFLIAWNVSDRRPAATVTAAGSRRERGFTAVLAAAIVMFVLAPVTLRAGRLWVNPPLLDGGLLVVVLAGMAWCWWARLHLGALWSAHVTRKEGHRIVDTGPYGLVRHPIYTGFIVIYLAVALIGATALGIAAAVVMTLGLWLKARFEEQFLAEALDAAAYASYQARTPMLVPRVTGRDAV